MLKKVVNIQKARNLGKNEQKTINGGFTGSECCVCAGLIGNPNNPFSPPVYGFVEQPCSEPCNGQVFPTGASGCF